MSVITQVDIFLSGVGFMLSVVYGLEGRPGLCFVAALACLVLASIGGMP